MGVEVKNPDGFWTFPAHDRADPAFKVEAHKLDPAKYFVHFDATHPLIVEHATGHPKFKIVDGKAIPFENGG